MQSLRYHRFAASIETRLEDIPVPAPAAGEVLVRVGCASVNPVDWKIASGQFRLLTRGGVPRTPGTDFAGEVAALGDGVEDWTTGEPVFGFIDPFRRVHGTFAEYVPVPVDHVFRRPPPVDVRTAAAVGGAGMTAVMLCNLAHVRSGSRVLVNGASGGVGHLAVQVAKARGARVTAVASAPRRTWLATLGADEFLDYRSVAPANWPGGFDAVIDCVPNLPRARHGRLLRRGGHYASTLPGPATFMLDPILNRSGRLRRHAVMLRPDLTALGEMLELIASGRLRPEVAGVYPLARASEAMTLSRGGHVAGKLVVQVA